MKKLFSAIFALSLVLLLSLSFVGCDNSQVIQYGKKYVSGDSFYVFTSDGWGYYETHHSYSSPYEKYTLSGRVDFIWETASDGKVYLFKKSETHFDDHTDGRTIGIITQPLAFGKDFFAYTYVTGYTGASTFTSRYIIQGSKLDDSSTNFLEYSR